jgi:hypothetical protein
MLSPEAGKMWFRIVFFLISISGLLLFVVEPGTAAYVATVLSFAVSLVFLAVLIIMIRLSRK